MGVLNQRVMISCIHISKTRYDRTETITQGHYLNVSKWLKNLGLKNINDLAAICDITLNHNSLFHTNSAKNSAKILSVDRDLEPFLHFLRTEGAANEDVGNAVADILEVFFLVLQDW